MTIAQFITRLRSESRDFTKPMHNDFTGDGATTLFVLTDSPVLEGSYVVKVDGSTKTDVTDYTLDLESGLLTFGTAPADTKAVTVDFKYVFLTNATWLYIINYILNDMEGEFWTDEVDDNFGDTVANQIPYTAPTRCVDVIQWWYKTADDDNLNWDMMSSYANWRYSKDLNQLLLGKAFNSAGYPMRVHYLKGFTRPTATSETLDLPAKYEDILQLGCLWRYYDHRLSNRVEIETKIAKERTITPLQNLQALSSHYQKLFLLEKGRKKPQKPTRIIGNYNRAGGTP